MRNNSLLNEKDGKFNFLRHFSQAKEILLNQKRDISLGFSELEIFFDNGGFPMGILVYIFAKSKVGKTHLVCYSINYLIQIGKKVLFISLEMTAVSIVIRLARLVMRSDVAELKKICQKNDGIDNIFHRFEQKGYFENLIIYDPPTTSLKDIESAILNFNPDVIFLDHLHRVTVEGAKDLFTQTTAISYGLSDIAKRTGKILVSLVQVSRGAEGHRAEDGSVMPSLAAGKGSGALEEVADVVIGMCRPEIDQSLARKRQHQIELRIIGNRFGRSSPNLVYFYDPESGMLTHEDVVERQRLYLERK